MNRLKRAAALCISTAFMASGLTGCYQRVSKDNYATTAVASFGDETIYLNEVNYYLKMLQVTYDSYFEYLYKPYYGFSSKKEFYDSTALTGSKKTTWDALKENAMATVKQTYILDFHATEYGISLTEDDKKKVQEAVDKFLKDTDPGVIDACAVDKDTLTDIYTRNALANKVWEYMVADIDTKVNEEDFRYTNVAYLAITEAKSTSSNDADKKDETVDLEKKAAEVLAVLKEQAEKNKEDKKDLPYNATIDAFKDQKNIKITYTASKEYGKPETNTSDSDKKDDSDKKTEETLQSICWNNLKTGEYTTWYDSKNKVSYVVYCTDDDVKESKEAAIKSELDNRKSKMFTEKYPDLVKKSPSFDINSRIYGQVKYQEISYKKTGADTSGNDVSDNDKE